MNKLVPLLFYAAIIYLAAKFSPAEEEKTASPRRSSTNTEITAPMSGQDTLAAQRAPMLMKYTAALNR